MIVLASPRTSDLKWISTDLTTVLETVKVICQCGLKEYTSPTNDKFAENVLWDVDEVVCSIASLSHQWILCSEWVPAV